MKKILSLLLALLLAASALVSCSEGGQNAENTDPQGSPSSPADAAPTEEPETELARENVPDNLPELDYAGATVVIHSRGDSESVTEVFVDELTGEAVADSIFERNAIVSERLNISIECFAGDGWENYNNTVSALRSSIMSADGAYDIIAGWSARIPALSLEGLFLDYTKLPYIDLAGPAKLLGTNTVDCMRSGALIGCAAMLDGVIDRMEEELGKPVTAVITGGVSPLILPYCKRHYHLEPDILIAGLQILYEKNRTK